MEILYNIIQRPIIPSVATIGSFDGVHKGHRFLIDNVIRIAKTKNYKSLLYTFSLHPRQVIDKSWNPMLLTTYSEKMKLLAETGIETCVIQDFTEELANYTALEFMNEVLKKQYNVQHLIIGYDHHFGHEKNESAEDYIRYGESVGIEVEKAPAFLYKKNIISSSFIRQMIIEGNVKDAINFLGYPYFIEGSVVMGNQIGRKIGFPTANISINNPNKLIPQNGVYAVIVHIGENSYQGMLNIGYRPTIGNNIERTIEVYILHFNKNIYNSPIKIDFIERLRSEEKFNDLSALKTQLEKDKKKVEDTLKKFNDIDKI